MTEETPLWESCKKVIVEVPTNSHVVIDPPSHTSLELDLALFSCLPSSLPLSTPLLSP